MVSSMWRCGGCLLGFGFGAVWMTAGIGSALVALLCAAGAYGISATLQRKQSARRAEAFFARKEREPRRRARSSSVAEPGW